MDGAILYAGLGHRGQRLVPCDCRVYSGTDKCRIRYRRPLGWLDPHQTSG